MEDLKHLDTNCVLCNEVLPIDMTQMLIECQNGRYESCCLKHENSKEFNAYIAINNFIRKNEYTYKVKDILESYQKYYIPKYYTSHTMKHCCENLGNEIEILLNKKRIL